MEEDGRELEDAWQAVLTSPIPLRDGLSASAMLRRAFEAGWDARGKCDSYPPDPEEGS